MTSNLHIECAHLSVDNNVKHTLSSRGGLSKVHTSIAMLFIGQWQCKVRWGCPLKSGEVITLYSTKKNVICASKSTHGLIKSQHAKAQPGRQAAQYRQQKQQLTENRYPGSRVVPTLIPAA